MRLACALALLFVSALAVGSCNGQLVSCSEDDDCPVAMQQCCTEHSLEMPEFGDTGYCSVDCSVEVKSARQKRSIGILARALGSIIQTLARWYRRRGTGTTTSTGLRIVTRRGGYAQARRDFDRYVAKADIESVRTINGGAGRVAIGRDGSRMIVRQRSSDGRPTLEFQNARGRSILKYRYEP